MAKEQLKELYRYIQKDSPQNAASVRADIVNALKKATDISGIFPPDKYRVNNIDNLYRAFELHRYRISYLVEPTAIVVTRIRHTSMEPKVY